MSEKKQKTPDKIVEATINCIERYGYNALTIRMIADEAGVNIAAVNYHFHSKENLVQRVKEISFNHMLEDLRDLSISTSISPRDITRAMCMYMIEGGTKFPEITRMTFYDAFIHNKIKSDSNKALSDLLSDFTDRISREYHIPKKDLTLALHRLFATLFFVSIFPGYFSDFTGYNLKVDKKARQDFVNSMIETLPY